MVRALLDPDEVRVNKLDPRVAIIYAELGDGFFLRIPIWVSNRDDRQNSVLSLRRARRREVDAGRSGGRQVWLKK